MKTTLHTFRITGLFLVLAGMALAGNAFAANTAANHIIRNTVTVTYDDAGGNPQAPVTDSVDITVLLVPKAPALSSPTDGTTDSATPYDYTYTLTATANGPDRYDLTAAAPVESAGISGSTTSFWQGASSITYVDLGASTVAIAGTVDGTLGNSTVITVPSDNNNADSMVNGIEVGDTVIIGGLPFTVTAINDTNGGVPNTTSTITVEGTGTANAAIIVTDLIAEQQTFTLRVTPGTVTSTSDETVDVTISVDGGPPTDATRTTVQVAALRVTKEVSTDGTNFAASANAAPGATLTYRITVENNGSADATSVVITDPLAPFTVYTGGSAKASSTNLDTYGSATNSDLTDASDSPTDEYDFTAGLATYDVGTIPAGQFRLFFFQVTVQ